MLQPSELVGSPRGKHRRKRQHEMKASFILLLYMTCDYYICDEISCTSAPVSQWSIFHLHELSCINYTTCMSTIYGLIIDPHNDYLPIGLMAQLVKHCSGITDVRVRVLFRADVFRTFFRYCSSLQVFEDPQRWIIPLLSLSFPSPRHSPPPHPFPHNIYCRLGTKKM